MNVVFDLGGVVFRWRPEAIVSRVFDSSPARQRALTEIIGHGDWIELDRGTIVLDQAIDRGSQRTGLPRDDIARLFAEVPPSLTPIPETIDLIRATRDAGNSVYVLSNMHRASIEYLEENHDFWGLFDGMVISCRIEMVKPEREIYEYLLATYRLQAADTVFIDDTSENLDAAASVGIRTVKFVDAGQCRRALTDLDCL